MRRFKHSLSHYKLVTADMGKLYPVTWFEALPGDTMRFRTSALIRVSPLVAPVMHPISVRFHWWFVPNRIIWPAANGTWEQFITGGKDGLGEGSSHPFISSGVGGWPAKSLGDYMGIPPSVGDLNVNALPFWAYLRIFNEFYRDQDLTDEVAETDVNTTDVQDIAWEKDYFTAARPTPQKGPDVTVPIGNEAPVIPSTSGRPHFKTASLSQTQLRMEGGGSNDVRSPDTVAGGSELMDWHSDTGLVTDLTGATATNVNDMRRAFAIQRYQENRSRWGSRLTEYLAFLGVRSSDARLQRPEYIGGGKSVIAFSEVLQHTEDGTNQNPLGRLGGHGIAATRTRRAVKFFEEHGIVMCLMSVRPRTMYSNALERSWSRKVKEDYWQRELEQIGQQEVYEREVYASGDAASGGTGDTVFGYNDRYQEYKHRFSEVHSEFRNTLNYWHMSREFGSAPALNDAFVKCDATKRIHAEQTNDSLWCMINHSIQARRMVRKGGSSRIY